jgi:hypothetical protein
MWSRNLELYTCTCHCCKECGVVILSYKHNNGMYMYIAQDYDSTFFTTMACTCIYLMITTPHSLQQWYVHVYSSRLRLHIICRNLELYTCTYYCCKECGIVILSYIHVHTIVVNNVES